MKVLVEAGLFRVRQCRHGAFAYVHTDVHVGHALDTYGEYAEGELELLGALLKPGDVAIDVGANVGTHAVVLAQRVGPGGAVLAFEPQRVLHQVLTTNATLNGITWLRAVHAAVGASSGAIDVPPIDYAQRGDFGGLQLGNWAHGEQVTVITLDSLALKRCALIKVDVRGMEAQVLEGAGALIAATKPVLYLAHDHAPVVIERLQGFGYQCWWHFSPSFRPDNFAGVKHDELHGLIEANIVAALPALAPAFTSLEPVSSPQDTASAAFSRRR
jgi:FkbM family methyltransferase